MLSNGNIAMHLLTFITEIFNIRGKWQRDLVMAWHSCQTNFVSHKRERLKKTKATFCITIFKLRRVLLEISLSWRERERWEGETTQKSTMQCLCRGKCVLRILVWLLLYIYMSECFYKDWKYLKNSYHVNPFLLTPKNCYQIIFLICKLLN